MYIKNYSALLFLLVCACIDQDNSKYVFINQNTPLIDSSFLASANTWKKAVDEYNQSKGVSCSPISRNTAFCWAFGNDVMERTALNEYGILMISSINRDKGEHPITRAYWTNGDDTVSLNFITSRSIPVVEDIVRHVFGKYRVDYYYLIPSFLTQLKSTIYVDYSKNKTGFPVVGIPNNNSVLNQIGFKAVKTFIYILKTCSLTVTTLSPSPMFLNMFSEREFGFKLSDDSLMNSGALHSIKVKDFYLGMNMMDAYYLANSKYGSILGKCNTQDLTQIHKSSFHFNSGAEFIGDSNGLLAKIYWPSTITNKLFGSGDLNASNFISEFKSAYGIGEFNVKTNQEYPDLIWAAAGGKVSQEIWTYIDSSGYAITISGHRQMEASDGTVMSTLSEGKSIEMELIPSKKQHQFD